MLRVLLDLRPALSGRAGIPQECRLLHWGLSRCAGLELAGLLQSGHAVLPWGRRGEVPAADIERALVVPRSNRWLHLARALPALAWARGAGERGARLPRVVGTTEAAKWWPVLFGQTLSSELAQGLLDLRCVPWPWMAAHACSVAAGAFGWTGQLRLDTSDFDVVVTQTPYPGRVSPSTALVVRYHDAVPILMTATTRSGSFDAAAHARALRANLRDGAWFACVSEAARAQLNRVCPPAAARSVVIPNMLAPVYRPEAPDPVRARSVMRARHRIGSPLSELGASPRSGPFLLMVSTIEPRKNHLRLIDAWQRLRERGHTDLDLVLVGSTGWQADPVLERLRPWVERGHAHHLESVEPEELRLLYATAAATVCPALSEGFGYSALESLASGGLVVASDIPAHREVCGDAASYFDPLDSTVMADSLAASLGLSAAQASHRRTVAGPLRAAAHDVLTLSARWRDWLATLAGC